MRQATEDRVTRDVFPEISGQPPAGVDPPVGTTERYSNASNGAFYGKHNQYLPAQEADDLRRYLPAERDAEAVARSGKPPRMDSTAVQLRQRIPPARAPLHAPGGSAGMTRSAP